MAITNPDHVEVEQQAQTLEQAIQQVRDRQSQISARLAQIPADIKQMSDELSRLNLVLNSTDDPEERTSLEEQKGTLRSQIFDANAESPRISKEWHVLERQANFAELCPRFVESIRNFSATLADLHARRQDTFTEEMMFRSHIIMFQRVLTGEPYFIAMVNDVNRFVEVTTFVKKAAEEGGLTVEELQSMINTNPSPEWARAIKWDEKEQLKRLRS